LESRQEKKCAVAGEIPAVHSKEAKAAFAKKRKALKDVAAATAAKKQKPARMGRSPMAWIRLPRSPHTSAWRADATVCSRAYSLFLFLYTSPVYPTLLLYSVV
jgi:hypothetical protein